LLKEVKVKMKKLTLYVSAILLITTLCFVSGPREAVAAFPDKPISFIVPFGAGGGTDGMVRAIAARLEKVIGVPVAVKNERGSGGRKGSIKLYKTKPDGYTIGLAHFATLIYDETLGKKKNPIDYRKFAAILKVDQALFFISVNKKSPFKSIDDFEKAGRPIKFGATGVGSPSYLFPKATQNAVGFQASFVTGQKNLVAASLAVARGDMDAAVGTYTHIRGLLEDLRPIVYISEKRSHKLPDVPTIKEAGYGDLAALAVPWIIVAPPGTPEDRLGVIRTALRKVVESKEFIDWATDAGYTPGSDGPDEIWKSLDELKALYEGLK
jgi:tripartite-type tricarboxylate transporter receptor subunit TctC